MGRSHRPFPDAWLSLASIGTGRRSASSALSLGDAFSQGIQETLPGEMGSFAALCAAARKKASSLAATWMQGRGTQLGRRRP